MANAETPKQTASTLGISYKTPKQTPKLFVKAETGAGKVLPAPLPGLRPSLCVTMFRIIFANIVASDYACVKEKMGLIFHVDIEHDKKLSFISPATQLN